MKTLRISDELHAFLRKQGVKGDTFEQVIWSLIGTKQMTRETEKDFKESQRRWMKAMEE